MSNDAPMHRVCFQLRVKPERLAEYTQRHAAVWPTFLEEMDAAGWRNYSIFSRGDGLLIGYFETTDLDAARDELNASPTNARWQAEMEEFFDRSSTNPADAFGDLIEVFNMQDQLATARARPELPE